MIKKFVPRNDYASINLPKGVHYRDVYKENYEEHLIGLLLFEEENKIEVKEDAGKEFPDLLIFGQFDINPFFKYLLKNKLIKSSSEINEVNIRNNKIYHDPNFSILKNGIVIRFLNIDYQNYKANIYYSKNNDSHVKFLQDIISNRSKFGVKIEKIKQNNIYLLKYSNQHGYSLVEHPMSQLEHFNIKDNYNDDFEEIHNIIIENLNKKDKNGLVLLHGMPGTGKTTYLRHLTSLVNKKIILVNNRFASNIDSPDLIQFLMEHRNSVMVVEDAENLIVSREKDSYSAVAGLLNMTDGLMGHCLNIQFVCTFNTKYSKIDDALKRKGRLIAEYEFGKLKKEKANKLFKDIGFDYEATEDMILADIFNLDDKDFTTKRESVGFKF